MKTPREIADGIMARAFKQTTRERADEYAALLSPGSEILDDIDAKFIAPFRFELVEALHRRGLEVEPIPGGYVVVERFVSGVIMDCRSCNSNWFRCGCDVGAVLNLGRATLPAMTCGRAEA